VEVEVGEGEGDGDGDGEGEGVGVEVGVEVELEDELSPQSPSLLVEVATAAACGDKIPAEDETAAAEGSHWGPRAVARV